MNILTDGTMSMVLLNSYGIVTCFVSNFLDMVAMSITSVIFGAILLLLVIAMCVVYYFKSIHFKECITIFSTNSTLRLARYHPIIMVIDRMCFCILATLTFQYSFSPYILLGEVAIYTLFISIKNPYELKSHLFRSLCI